MRMRYDAGAAAYDQTTGRWSRLFASAVIDAAEVKTGERVLDIATGTGDAVLLAAERLGASGAAIAVDLSLPMLLVADTKRSAETVRFVAADAQILPFRDATFDAALCLFGLMFFPDRVAALRHTRHLLRRGRRMVATVWGPWNRAPFAGIVAEALSREMPADRDELFRPFALADPAVLGHLLAAAGFRDTRVTPIIRKAHFVSFEDFWGPVEAGGGRLGQAYLGLSEDARARVVRTAQELIVNFTGSDGITMDLEAYIATGTA